MPSFNDLPRGLPHSPEGSGFASRVVWNDPQEVAAKWAFSDGKIYLGQTENGEHIGFSDNRHLLTVAGSRAGKGQSAILPNLALYGGSVLVLDPKGENATLTAERRGKGRGIEAGGLGQSVYVLDPFGVADVAEEYRASFNPIATLDPASPFFVDDCDSIADALVVGSPQNKDDHWHSSARMVLRGFVAWVAASPTVEKRDLVELRRLLFLPPVVEDGQGFDRLLGVMAADRDLAGGVPADMAAAVMGMGEDEAGSVLSTVRDNILFLSSPPIARMFEGGQRSPNLDDWKMGGSSIFLCLPATRLHRHARFFRLFINRLMASIEGRKETPALPALMILDEMHVLGHMAVLETAAGLVAGYGVRIWSIWQDFAQLKDLYRDRWETFLGNASLIQAFGLNDLTTLKYMSERLGVSSILSISRSDLSAEQEARGISGESKSIQQSSLLTTEEVATFFGRQTLNQLLIFAGAQPIFLKRSEYHTEHFAKFRNKNNA